MADLKHCMLKWCVIAQELYEQKEFGGDTEDESGAGTEIRSLQRRMDNFESALLQVKYFCFP